MYGDFRERCGGYLTVYLTMLLAVLLSLCLALIEGVRSHALYLEGACAVDSGLNSVLAEYHKELFAQYNLLAIDSSYGTRQSGHGHVAAHLQDYLSKNLSGAGDLLGGKKSRDFLALTPQTVDVTKMQLLTDEVGIAYRRQAVEAIKDEVGIASLAQLQAWMSLAEQQNIFSRNLEEEQDILDRQMQEVVTSTDESPVKSIASIRKDSFLTTVLGEEEQLSKKRLQSDHLIGGRNNRGEISRGNWMREADDNFDPKDRYWFQEYLLRYMGSYRNPKTEGVLSYQIEYLLAGKETDRDNLSSVAKKLCGMREVANLLYLYSDLHKCEQVKEMAASASLLLLSPEAEPVLEAVIFLGWAYMESVHDVRMLLAGERVPLMKDASCWHYDLQEALQAKQKDTKSTQGLLYEDYLRLLLFGQTKENLTWRSMDMVEGDIRLTPGNQAFRLDSCVNAVEVSVQIKSQYGYLADWTRCARYDSHTDGE